MSLSSVAMRNAAVASTSGRSCQPSDVVCAPSCTALALRPGRLHKVGLGPATPAALAALSRQQQHLRLPRRHVLVAQAAASSGAVPAPDGDASSSNPGRQSPQSQQPPLSFREQRMASMRDKWRRTQLSVRQRRQEMSAAFRALPPVAAMLRAWAALQQALAPLYAALEALRMRREALIEDYNNYLAQETKLRWRWDHQYAKEVEWWNSMPRYLGWLLVALVYHAFTPVSFTISLVAPLYFAWAMWDHWLVSPVFLATLAMSFLKWVPWAGGVACWVWPGLI